MPYSAYRIGSIGYFVGYSFNHSHFATALEPVMHFEMTILEPSPGFGFISPHLFVSTLTCVMGLLLEVRVLGWNNRFSSRLETDSAATDLDLITFITAAVQFSKN